MAQGGRGWFHRKRHRPDPEQPTGTTHASSLAAQQAQPNPSTQPAVGPPAGAADNTQWSPEARSAPQPPQMSAAVPPSSPVGESSSLGPAPAGASPAVAQGWPGGGAEADSAGIAGAAASQSTASQWTRRSRLPGARDGGLRRRSRNIDLPGTRAGRAGRRRIADGRTDLVRHGAPRIDRRPVVSCRAGAGGHDTLGEPSAGAHSCTRRRRRTDATADDDLADAEQHGPGDPPRPRREATTGMPRPRRR